jgi:hypothetical protein
MNWINEKIIERMRSEAFKDFATSFVAGIVVALVLYWCGFEILKWYLEKGSP